MDMQSCQCHLYETRKRLEKVKTMFNDKQRVDLCSNHQQSERLLLEVQKYLILTIYKPQLFKASIKCLSNSYSSFKPSQLKNQQLLQSKLQNNNLRLIFQKEQEKRNNQNYRDLIVNHMNKEYERLILQTKEQNIKIKQQDNTLKQLQHRLQLQNKINNDIMQLLKQKQNEKQWLQTKIISQLKKIGQLEDKLKRNKKQLEVSKNQFDQKKSQFVTKIQYYEGQIAKLNAQTQALKKDNRTHLLQAQNIRICQLQKQLTSSRSLSNESTKSINRLLNRNCQMEEQLKIHHNNCSKLLTETEHEMSKDYLKENLIRKYEEKISKLIKENSQLKKQIQIDHLDYEKRWFLLETSELDQTKFRNVSIINGDDNAQNHNVQRMMISTSDHSVLEFIWELENYNPHNVQKE